MPSIKYISNNYFIPGYETEALINESIRILLHAINIYDLDKHRFVSYGLNAIKNNLNYIYRKTSKREIIIYEETYNQIEDELNYEEEIHTSLFLKKLTKTLNEEEKKPLT